MSLWGAVLGTKLAIRSEVLSISRWPAALDGCCVAQLSDLHLRRWSRPLDEANRRLKEEQPDLLALTGDFSDRGAGPQRTAELLRRLLDGVSPRWGCYAVPGNHDDETLGTLLPPTVRLLINEYILLRCNGGELAIAGLDGRSRGGWDIPETLIGVRPDICTLLLSHYPQAIFQLPPARVDLMLAGDTHGGQVRLPFIGPLCPTYPGLGRRYCRGTHVIAGVILHVNSGIGSARRLPMRVCCPPELSLLTLRSKAQAPADAESSATSDPRSVLL